MMREIARTGLQVHVERVRALRARHLRHRAGRVAFPTALMRTPPGWAVDPAWQWVFPASRSYRDAASREDRRHHVHATVMQRAMQRAVRAAGIAKRATSIRSGTRLRRTFRRLGTISGRFRDAWGRPM